MKKAIALISGGLDSLLAAKLIMEQGIQVEGINFFTGFTGDNESGIKKTDASIYNASWVAKRLGIKLNLVNIVDEFKSVLLGPKYGYGKYLNPCLDCKLFMITKALEWMKQHQFDFLISGEVLGQRPKSQRKDTLPIATQNTGNLILRPLSAKLLPPTIPEIEGWVDRNLLESFNGRSRKPQIALAKQFGFSEFPQPAGGCILTDAKFCDRLQDLLQHQSIPNYSLDDILLMRVGRHLRISDRYKVIVGRDESENNVLEKYQSKGFLSLQSISHPGALLLIIGTANIDDLQFCARLAAYFSRGKNFEEVTVAIFNGASTLELAQQIKVKPLAESEVIKEWYL